MTDIDWTVTLYKLFLGEQQTEPPYQFQMGYSIHAIEIAIFPEGSPFFNFSLGTHGTYNASGYTEYLVTAGDVVLDQLGHYYEVKPKPKRWGLGNRLDFLACAMEEMPNFPFLSGFFGYEDVDHGTIGYGYEDGYERGQWAL